MLTIQYYALIVLGVNTNNIQIGYKSDGIDVVAQCQ